MNTPFLWYMKYRPTNFVDLSERDDIIRLLKNLAISNDIPHLIFTGPKGYGKMEVARLFAQYILGNGFETNCKIVYAADPLSQIERDETHKESYISTRRIGSTAGQRFTWPAFIFSRIKPFVEIKPIGFHPLKILIIEDFHLLDNQQQGFRRLMERYSSYCRMILLTDQISSVIDPIISRCNVLFFKKIEFSVFEKKILEVAQQEHLTLRENIPKTLYISTNADLEKAISHLQIASLISPDITTDMIYRTAKSDLNENINLVLQNALSLKTNRLKNPLTQIKKSGRTFAEVIEIMTEEVYNLPLVDAIKAEILDRLSSIDFHAVDASSDELLVDNLVYNLCELGRTIT